MAGRHRTRAHQFSLFGYAEQRIPSVLAGICNASAPLFGALVAAAVLPDERLSARRMAGLTTGLLGVFVVLGAWAGLAGHDYDIIAAAGATIATTVGYVMPLVSILAGIALLGERLTWNEPVGAAVIVIGAVLVQARTRGFRGSGSADSVPEQRGSVAAGEGLASAQPGEETGDRAAGPGVRAPRRDEELAAVDRGDENRLADLRRHVTAEWNASYRRRRQAS